MTAARRWRRPAGRALDRHDLAVGPAGGRRFDRGALREAWALHRESMLDDYRQRQPAERPRAWWTLEAPDFRYEDEDGVDELEALARRDLAELEFLIDTGEVGLEEARALVRLEARDLPDDDDTELDEFLHGPARALIALIEARFSRSIP